MPQTVDDYAIDLERSPECARRIGIILGLFVQIEHGLVPILSWTTGMSLDQAQVALELQKQNGRKMVFLHRMCEGITPEEPHDVAAGKAFAAAASTANLIRNTNAHASYHAVGDARPEELEVAVFSDNPRSASRVQIATVDILDAEIHFLKSLIVAMRNYAEARAANTPVNLQEIEQVAANHPRPVLPNP
jgi:hypothetical protein